MLITYSHCPTIYPSAAWSASLHASGQSALFSWEPRLVPHSHLLTGFLPWGCCHHQKLSGAIWKAICLGLGAVPPISQELILQGSVFSKVSTVSWNWSIIEKTFLRKETGGFRNSGQKVNKIKGRYWTRSTAGQGRSRCCCYFVGGLGTHVHSWMEKWGFCTTGQSFSKSSPRDVIQRQAAIQ